MAHAHPTNGTRGAALQAVAGLVVLTASVLTGVNERPAPQNRSADPAVLPLVSRATAYVTAFVQRFTNVVAEEEYLQEYIHIPRHPAGFLEAPRVLDRRRLRSDFLLVKTPATRDWFAFRDVFEVNGRAVRDRQERLTALFLDPSRAATALEDAHRVALEGARHHLRDIGTIDHPLLALGFLQAPYRQQFEYAIAGPDTSGEAGIWIVAFSEARRPTIIRGRNDEDVPARGRYWIEAATGRISKTELSLAELRMQSRVETTFRLDERFQMLVPVEMRTTFRFAGGDLARAPELRGTASYGEFRQFEVRSEGSVRPPAAVPVTR